MTLPNRIAFVYLCGFTSAVFLFCIALACDDAYAQDSNNPPPPSASESDGLRQLSADRALIETYSSLGIMIERRYRGGWTIAGCPTLASVALSKADEQRYRFKRRQAFVDAIPKLSELRPIVEIDLLPPEWFEDSDVELLFRHIDPSQLRSFRVMSPHISDRIVPLLEKATSLIELDLGETQVSNEVGKALSGMGSLRSLSLKSTRITHDLAIHLMNHQSLTRLSLEGTEFGDDGIPAISTIHTLKILNLSNTTLTDESIPALQRLGSLRHLNIAKTQISNERAQLLKNSLGCTLIAP